jgi:hypothetical protein
LNVDRFIYPIDRRTTLQPLSRDQAQNWRYTPQAPGEGWAGLDFDDSTWSEGEPIFGRIKKKETDDPDAEPDPRVVRTPWDTEEIWLRRAIDIPNPEGLEDFDLLVDYRGTYEIYVNGVLATLPDDDTSGYKELEMRGEAAQAFRKGRNVLAVHLKRTVAGDGDQYVDAGLRALAKPDLGKPRRRDADKAAWVVVAHVLLNLDETLTKR